MTRMGGGTSIPDVRFPPKPACPLPTIADIQRLQLLRFDHVEVARYIKNSGPQQIDPQRPNQWHLRTPNSFKFDQIEEPL